MPKFAGKQEIIKAETEIETVSMSLRLGEKQDNLGVYFWGYCS